MAFFRFRRGTVPLDDNNLANAKEQGALVSYSTIAFPQFRVRQSMIALQHPQLYSYAGSKVSGVGGLIQGGVVFQSLIRNPNATS